MAELGGGTDVAGGQSADARGCHGRPSSGRAGDRMVGRDPDIWRAAGRLPVALARAACLPDSPAPRSGGVRPAHGLRCPSGSVRRNACHRCRADPVLRRCRDRLVVGAGADHPAHRDLLAGSRMGRRAVCGHRVRGVSDVRRGDLVPGAERAAGARRADACECRTHRHA